MSVEDKKSIGAESSFKTEKDDYKTSSGLEDEVDNLKRKKNSLSMNDFSTLITPDHIKGSDEVFSKTVNSPDSSASSPGTNPKTSLPDHIIDKYNKNGEHFYYKDSPKKLAFIDKTNLLETEQNKRNVTDSMIDIAIHRKWPEIHVTGTDSFRQHVWQKASEQGITVHGYTPSEKELAFFKSTLEREGSDASKKETNPNQSASLPSNRIQNIATKLDNPERRQSFIDVSTTKINQQDSLEKEKPIQQDKPKDKKNHSMSP